jgi:hypothetical protein
MGFHYRTKTRRLATAVALIGLIVWNTSEVRAQELNCQVRVNAPQVQSTNRQVFQTLQQALFEFMNNRRWTEDVYTMEERIECSIQITITEQIGADRFKGFIQVQSSRPVYGSSYSSTILNYRDNDVFFQYVEFEPLLFNANTYESNLTSLMAFYAYLIIGLDQESFAPNGGEPIFDIAQKVINNAQTDDDVLGWNSFDGDRNRYWIIENLRNRDFEAFRTAMYQYYRLGLDLMSKNVVDGRKGVTDAINELKSVHSRRPNSLLVRMFMDANADEIVSVYSDQSVQNKGDVIQTLNNIAPNQSTKWNKINGDN